MDLQQQFESGMSQHRAGQLAEAEAAYRQVLSRDPNHTGALNLLGLIAGQCGNDDKAIELIGRAVQLSPDYAEARINLGNSLVRKGRFGEGVLAYQHAIKVKPDLFAAYCNMSAALKELGRLDESIAAANRAIELNPGSAEAFNNLGAAQSRKREFEKAAASYRRAIELNPNYAEAFSNLGVFWAERGKPDESVAALQRAIQIDPRTPKIYCHLGNTLKDMGQMDQAIGCYRQAIRANPQDSSVHSNLLYAIHFDSGYDAAAVYEEHRRWDRQHAEPLKGLIQPHKNDADPDRPLRIGYVSPDFCSHPVGRFIHPLLAAHNRGEFEICCYADVHRPDRTTDLIRGKAHVWRNVLGVPPDAAAELIREDRIDVLVDLTMHMADNRMLLFARKPAPVQVTYLAYCSTTGLSAMDYRLTDPHLDPPGISDAYYSEASIRLPETYWCYEPPVVSPDVNPSPATNLGYVTFGCLNNFCKVSPAALQAWIQLMRRTGNSRLILHALEGSHRQRVREMFQGQGVDPQRLRFVGRIPFLEFLKLHQEIDIALDSFPYSGGTTTCDALWMGVPVISWGGQMGVARSGVSLLRNIGLPELIADSPEQYVEIAGKLAGNLPRLAELRRTMRGRMRESPLMDAARFARNVEGAYRQMWRTWCAAAK